MLEIWGKGVTSVAVKQLHRLKWRLGRPCFSKASHDTHTDGNRPKLSRVDNMTDVMRMTKFEGI